MGALEADFDSVEGIGRETGWLWGVASRSAISRSRQALGWGWHWRAL